MQKNIPERQWSLGMLATVAPQHDVFKKGFKPAPKRQANQRLELSKQKKQADLMLMDDENSDEDFFKYKISAKDFGLLQQAKA